ncbi:hypothetical protein BASA81_001274 [Batrachochytrium salamandrivorans]|nr:hypothetical protein BASA81_001274 [Batrachochytrium salamandrivorans]
MASTSLHIFREHLKILPDGTVDASRIHSMECYQRWLAVRKAVDSDSEARKYQRALSNHLSGVDGRSSFEKDEEAAILAVLRVKQRWPCFPTRMVGLSGFRARGYHEKSSGDGGEETSAAAGKAPSISSRAKKPKLGSQPSITTTTTTTAILANENEQVRHQLQMYVVDALAASAAAPDAVVPMIAPIVSIASITATAAAPAAAAPITPITTTTTTTAAAVPLEEDLAHLLTSYARTFPTFNEEAWAGMHQVFRLMVLSHSPVCSLSVDPMHAHHLCHAVACHKGPDFFVLVVDVTSKEFPKRMVAQSELSIHLFGMLMGHFAGTLIHERDSDRYLFSLVACLQQPGHEFELRRMILPCLGEVPMAMYFDCTLAADPLSYLFVFSGRLTDGSGEVMY